MLPDIALVLVALGFHMQPAPGCGGRPADRPAPVLQYSIQFCTGRLCHRNVSASALQRCFSVKSISAAVGIRRGRCAPTRGPAAGRPRDIGRQNHVWPSHPRLVHGRPFVRSLALGRGRKMQSGGESQWRAWSCSACDAEAGPVKRAKHTGAALK